MKRVLIAGKNSYIGNSVKQFLSTFPEEYSVEELSTIDLNPQPSMFAGYDVVFCVAGIAHIKETKDNRDLFFKINHELVVKIAKAAKEGGVKQFILLSSMSVYGLLTGHITKDTLPHPNTAYGESKLKADEDIKKLESDSFKFACLRPPMVYGKRCTGNYQRLRSFAIKCPFFPDYDNQRSMVYIGNLSSFVKDVIAKEKSGLFFPQNSEYVRTSDMVRSIAENNGKSIKLTRVFNPIIRIVQMSIIKKVFGSLTYEAVDLINKYDLPNSIRVTEE